MKMVRPYRLHQVVRFVSAACMLYVFAGEAGMVARAIDAAPAIEPPPTPGV